MFCPRCGTNNPETNASCHVCGQDLAAAAAGLATAEPTGVKVASRVPTGRVHAATMLGVAQPGQGSHTPPPTAAPATGGFAAVPGPPSAKLPQRQATMMGVAGPAPGSFEAVSGGAPFVAPPVAPYVAPTPPSPAAHPAAPVPYAAPYSPAPAPHAAPYSPAPAPHAAPYSPAPAPHAAPYSPAPAPFATPQAPPQGAPPQVAPPHGPKPQDLAAPPVVASPPVVIQPPVASARRGLPSRRMAETMMGIPGAAPGSVTPTGVAPSTSPTSAPGIARALTPDRVVPSPRAQLIHIIRVQGASLINRGSPLESVLMGDLAHDVGLLVAARELGIAEALHTAPPAGGMGAHVTALAEQLRAARGCSEDDARYAVESWALALGLIEPVA